MALQRLLHEVKCGLFITGFCDKALEDFAFVINRAPEVVRLAVDVGFAALRVTYISSRCHRQWVTPRIRLTRCRRMSLANIGPKRFHQNLTVSWQRSMPRSNSRSSTLRSDKGKRMCIITTRRITSGDELKQRNGLGGFALDFRFMRARYQPWPRCATLV